MKDSNLKPEKIRLRFAPSPTGFLHLGNLRSALFGYLISKNLGGKFLLRIEDTDQKREVEGAVESLVSILNWVGIQFDEGPHIGGEYGPYVQTKRLGTYAELSRRLLDEGKAYPCFCSEERLKNMREEQEKNKLAPRYDRTCRRLSREEASARIAAGESYVVRQAMPESGEIKVKDEIRGEISFRAQDLDDHVLIKSDGVPTYQFANIVDDHLMEISHVTRGDEWLPSFPKNILLYQAFGWTPPKFIHLPLILNKGGGKLSKRQGDVFVENYRAKGYIPEAIVNFCALLGWHPENDQEIFSLTELEKEFSLSGLGSSPAIFDAEKLDFFNGYYLRRKSLEELYELTKPYLEAAGHNTEETDKIKRFLALGQERIKTLADIKDACAFLFALPDYDPATLVWKKSNFESAQRNLSSLKAILSKIENKSWKTEELEKTIMDYIKHENGQNGDYLWPLRVALSGLKNSPGPFEILWALGKEESLARLNRALALK